MLHIVKSVSALSDLHPYLAEQDLVLLVEDAVYAANPQHKAHGLLNLPLTYVLNADADARAITNRIGPALKRVDYAGFVELTELELQSLTWD
ncbi:sulfurtransferase complex subunit TusB [Vibrio sp.]|uniref:sulfurtransferase complex subunit TusB n=1 Tax=Vibrio sp. TaxID=678 RepID=UPI003D09C24B